MILGQAVDHLTQSQQSGGGQDAGLAHTAAQALAFRPGLGDHVLRPGQQ